MGKPSIMAVVVVVVSVVFFLPVTIVDADTGPAIFYKPPYYPSACSRVGNVGSMVTGVSDQLWNNGQACGSKYRVTCIRGLNEAPHPCIQGASVTVTVIDYCAAVCNGTLNLSRDAFSEIADLNAGKVLVSYDRVY